MAPFIFSKLPFYTIIWTQLIVKREHGKILYRIERKMAIP